MIRQQITYLLPFHKTQQETKKKINYGAVLRRGGSDYRDAMKRRINKAKGIRRRRKNSTTVKKSEGCTASWSPRFVEHVHSRVFSSPERDKRIKRGALEKKWTKHKQNTKGKNTRDQKNNQERIVVY